MNNISLKKPAKADAAIFKQFVAMACPPKPRRRRMLLAKRVGQASRVPVFESKRDACATFFKELIGIRALKLYFTFVIQQEDRA